MDLYLAQSSNPAPLGKDARYLCFSWGALDSLSRLGLTVQPWERMFPLERAPEIAERVNQLAESWYRDGVADFTLFGEASLGEAHRWQVWHSAIQPAYRFLAAMRGAIDADRPSVVYCETSLPAPYRAVLSSLHAQVGGFRLEWLERSGGGDSIFTVSRPSYLRVGRLKAWAYRALNAIAKMRVGFRKTDVPVIFFSYYGSLDRVLQRLSSGESAVRCVVADFPLRSAWRRAVSSSLELIVEPLTPLSWEPSHVQRLQAIRTAWARVKSLKPYREKFTWEGVSLFDAISPFLEDFFERDLEYTAWTSAKLSELWDKRHPSVVVLPFDTPPYQSLMAQLARSRGIPCVVMLHGLPFDLRAPFAEKSASHLLVWGGEQKRLYDAIDGSGRRVVRAVGNPGFDRYASVPQTPRGGLTKILVLPRTRWPDVLVSSSDTEPEAYAVKVAEVLRSGPFEVTLRPHPAESPDYYRELLRPIDPAIRIVTEGTLSECLAEADLVISAYTTALLEAVLLGKPVLCVNFTRAAYAAPFDGSWGITPVGDPKELAARIGEIILDPKGAGDRIRACYPRIIEAFAGPQDGCSAERAAEAVLQIALASRRPGALIP